MKTLTTILLTAAATWLIIQFSPLRSPAVQPPAAGLLSPLELQQQINAVLLRYRMPTIKEDGQIGPRTGAAYMEAYSLEQVENMERNNYELRR